jgi:hypothetical protein
VDSERGVGEQCPQHRGRPAGLEFHQLVRAGALSAHQVRSGLAALKNEATPKAGPPLIWKLPFATPSVPTVTTIIAGRMSHAASAAAAPGRPRMADCYPYQIANRRGEITLIWRPGESDAPDELAIDELGRLLTFPDLKTLQDHCDRNGWELVRDGGATLDLGVVHQWVENPDLDTASAEMLLDAWNFFEDLSHSLQGGPPLPSQGSTHESAYEKIFGGDALEPTAGEEAWTDEETAVVRELLRVGLGLWEEAVRGSGAD